MTTTRIIANKILDSISANDKPNYWRLWNLNQKKNWVKASYSCSAAVAEIVGEEM